MTRREIDMGKQGYYDRTYDHVCNLCDKLGVEKPSGMDSIVDSLVKIIETVAEKQESSKGDIKWQTVSNHNQSQDK